MGAWRAVDNGLVQVYQVHSLTRALWGCVWRPSVQGGRWEAKLAPSPRVSKQRFLGAFATEAQAKETVQRAVDRRAK